MRRTFLATVIFVFFVSFLLKSGISLANPTSLSIPQTDKLSELVRLNGDLKAEGYYTGEIEFKFLGIVYYLDRGDSATASAKLDQLYHQLKTREGLIKVPKFANKEEALSFYLGLQNPKTGAFMDDSYPLFTYIGPTLNVLEHLELLAKETGQPLRLKYPLRFLDEINTGQKLKAFLDDLAFVGPVGSLMPKTPYIAATELISYDEIERNHLYIFTPEWKHTLLQWYYDNQDSKTGYWGSRLKGSGVLLRAGELGTSFHIAKLFVDGDGNNRYQQFPLRHRDAIVSTTLQKLSEPMPADLADLHDWSLTRYQGIKLLTDFLWNDASADNRESARILMANLIRNRFESFYIPHEGAFSLYTGSSEADLDGTGIALSMLKIAGALPGEQRERLWGSPEKTVTDLGLHEVSKLTERDFASIQTAQGINSIRLYSADPAPDSYATNVVSVFYPKETPVLDIVDLLPKINQWVNTTPQSMGNWESKEAIIDDLASIKVKPAPVSRGNIPITLANEILRDYHVLIAIGFDTMQIPRFKITYKLKRNTE